MFTFWLGQDAVQITALSFPRAVLLPSFAPNFLRTSLFRLKKHHLSAHHLLCKGLIAPPLCFLYAHQLHSLLSYSCPACRRLEPHRIAIAATLQALQRYAASAQDLSLRR